LTTAKALDEMFWSFAIPELREKLAPWRGMTLPTFHVRKVTWGLPDSVFTRRKGDPAPAVTSSRSAGAAEVREKLTNQSLHPVTFTSPKEAEFHPAAVEPRYMSWSKKALK